MRLEDAELALIRKKGECRHGKVDMNAAGLLRPLTTQEELCDTCPIKNRCRDWALANDPLGEWEDVWGGLTGAQRAAIHDAHNAPRCPACGSDAVMIMDRNETCIACGASWSF